MKIDPVTRKDRRPQQETSGACTEEGGTQIESAGGCDDDPNDHPKAGASVDAD